MCQTLIVLEASLTLQTLYIYIPKSHSHPAWESTLNGSPVKFSKVCPWDIRGSEASIEPSVVWAQHYLTMRESEIWIPFYVPYFYSRICRMEILKKCIRPRSSHTVSVNMVIFLGILPQSLLNYIVILNVMEKWWRKEKQLDISYNSAPPVLYMTTCDLAGVV